MEARTILEYLSTVQERVFSGEKRNRNNGVDPELVYKKHVLERRDKIILDISSHTKIYDCGFHVLLYIHGYEKGDIYNITKENVSMFRKRLVRDLLYNNQNKRNPACASASNEDVEEEHDGANEHEEEHDNDANSVPDIDASVQASQENGEARQEDEDTVRRTEEVAANQVNEEIRKEEHDNDDETMCENEEAETGGGPPEEDINTSESKEAPKSITPSNKRIISPNTQLRKMMTSSTVVSLHNQRNTTSLPTAKSLHNQRDTTSSSTSKQVSREVLESRSKHLHHIVCSEDSMLSETNMLSWIC